MQHIKKNTILIVDDSRAIVKILSNILRSHYTLRVALNGEKAVQIIQGDKSIDLIILDVLMPGMDGYEVCEILKASPETKDIPVIFLTARALTEDEYKGFEVGAVDYITKPIIPAIVLARVNTHIRLSNVSNSIKKNLNGLKMVNCEYIESFSASIAHNLDATLCEIDRYSSIVESKNISGKMEMGFDYLHNIRCNIKRIREVIDNLLSFSRIKRGKIEDQLATDGRNSIK
jgi:DNA-binding response OmpR family regulator